MGETETYEAIIVGAGPAGLAAGLYCQRAALKTVLFEKGMIGGQIAVSKDVENYPGVEGITGFDLAERMVTHAKNFGLNIVQQEVMEIQTGSDLHTLRLGNGDLVRTAALILALGGTARKLNVPGEAEYLASGVSYCATCDGFFFRDKTVLVVGGGDTAVEEALYLGKIAKKVYLVHRRDSLRASKILQDRLFADPRIEPVWNTVVTSINGDGKVVRSASCENIVNGEKRDLTVEGVFIFIGFDPSNSLIPGGVRLNERGYVITNERCETDVPGIFVAGDLRQKFANQIVVAAAEGCIAALAAAYYVEMNKAGA